jgi:hypothetical protein
VIPPAVRRYLAVQRSRLALLVALRGLDSAWLRYQQTCGRVAELPAGWFDQAVERCLRDLARALELVLIGCRDLAAALEDKGDGDNTRNGRGNSGEP